MRPPRVAPVVDLDYRRRIEQVGLDAGLHRVGVTDAEVLHRARHELHRRRDLGLHDGMSFTYRNPERSTDPAASVRNAAAVVVGARSYWMDQPQRPAGAQGRVARYAWVDHYEPLRRALWAVAHRLRADGFAAVVFADDNSLVDREVAWKAGLGWFGKNANLLLPDAGSWFVLGAVVTDAPLPADVGQLDDGCGRCRRCIPACPTGAIVADGVIDAARCLAWVLQKPGVIPRHLRVAVGDRMYGCDDCQTSCPPATRFGARLTVTGVGAPTAWLDVVALLAADDDEVLTTWGRWYLADRDPVWARRNALVVLGNVGDGHDRAVERVLRAHLAHREAVVRLHATWAARRLGRPDLLPADETDPDVRAEQTCPL